MLLLQSKEGYVTAEAFMASTMWCSFRRPFSCRVLMRTGIRLYTSKPDVFGGNRVWNVRYEAEGKLVPKEEGEKTLPKFTSYVPVDIVLKFSKDWDISWTGIKKWYKRLDMLDTYHDQRFIPERLEILGPDLAAAHFIVARGGGVRFKGQNKWIRTEKYDANTLPRKYVAGAAVEALDLRGVPIIYEGMVNLVNLRDLRWLSFRGCENFDDWFCDWLGRYSETLEYLDIGSCKNVTERGVSILHRLRKLRTLVVDDLPNFNHRKLVCLMLNDVVPDCKIVGLGGEDVVDLLPLDDAEKEKQRNQLIQT